MTGLAEDLLAIQNVKARYCAAADLAAADPAGARAMFATIFTADFRGDYGVGPLAGPEAIVDFLCAGIASSSEWMLHMIHTPDIRIEGDSAEAIWTVMAVMQRRNGGPRDTVLGRYADTMHRTPDGWRIARLRFSRVA
ncbi:MAG: nuclear transport factor 2 family protein [Sandarakinorhabdus sp.]|nr:nuclear transport factor 2 family protein [Sandarakinorhabdus sp.]